MLELIFLLPFIAGIIAAFLPVASGRVLLMAAAVSHLLLVGLGWLGKLTPLYGMYFNNSPEGMIVLLIVSFVFLFISLYTVSFLKETKMQSESVFTGCMLLFLAAMSMVALSDHLIVFWIAIEATTLASAPLIFLNRSKEALEATWKYVLICSVGIALALLGSFFVTLSMELGQVHVPLTFSNLYSHAASFNPIWLKTGFIFLMIGYGTKMGLAPMHTWLPDAHSQAPSPASALLSGTLLNCAFLGVYKAHALMVAAGMGEYSSNVLIGFGLVSMLIAGIFIIQQPDYKRMLAYSSVENMGIVAIGVGVGGIALYGAFLHLIHHSMIKSSLFLSAGNILSAYSTKLAKEIGNMAGLQPKTFVGFFSGFVGISGFPPFGLFVSKMLIIVGAFHDRRYLVMGVFLFCLVLIFSGAAKMVMRMSFGKTDLQNLPKEKLWRVAPPVVLLLTSMVLCFWVPDWLYTVIQEAIAVVGGAN